MTNTLQKVIKNDQVQYVHILIQRVTLFDKRVGNVALMGQGIKSQKINHFTIVISASDMIVV